MINLINPYRFGGDEQQTFEGDNVDEVVAALPTMQEGDILYMTIDAFCETAEGQITVEVSFDGGSNYLTDPEVHVHYMSVGSSVINDFNSRDRSTFFFNNIAAGVGGARRQRGIYILYDNHHPDNRAKLVNFYPAPCANSTNFQHIQSITHFEEAPSASQKITHMKFLNGDGTNNVSIKVHFNLLRPGTGWVGKNPITDLQTDTGTSVDGPDITLSDFSLGDEDVLLAKALIQGDVDDLYQNLRASDEADPGPYTFDIPFSSHSHGFVESARRSYTSTSTTLGPVMTSVDNGFEPSNLEEGKLLIDLAMFDLTRSGVAAQIVGKASYGRRTDFRGAIMHFGAVTTSEPTLTALQFQRGGSATNQCDHVIGWYKWSPGDLGT